MATATKNAGKVPALASKKPARGSKAPKADKAATEVKDAAPTAPVAEKVPATPTQVAQGTPTNPVVAPTNPLHAAILTCDALKDGASATSRMVVLSLGRKCGQKEGQPVVNYLHRLVSQELIREVQNGHGAMYSWQLTDKGEAERTKLLAAK